MEVGEIDYDEARGLAALKDGVRTCWTSFVAARPGERIYGFGLYDAAEHGHVDVLILSEEGLDVAARRFGYDRRAGRWSAGDSPYLLAPMPGGAAGSLGWPCVLGGRQIDELPRDEDHEEAWEAAFDRYHDSVRACLIRALQELDAEGLFGDRRKSLVLLVTDEEQTQVHHSVIQLNPADVAAQFAIDYVECEDVRRDAF